MIIDNSVIEQEQIIDIPETAIIPVNDRTIKLQPQDIETFAKYAVESGLFKDVKTVAQAYIKAWAGQELGLPPAYAMRSLYWVETKDGHSHIGMTANVIATLIKKSGKYDYRVKEMTDIRCSIIFYERGKELGSYTYTTQDARKANLLSKPTWVGYTRDMLWNRAMSLGANKFTPDVKLGYLTVEEIQNLDSLDIENPPPPVDSKTATGFTTAPTEGINPSPSTNPLVEAAIGAGAVVQEVCAIHGVVMEEGYSAKTKQNYWYHDIDGERCFSNVKPYRALVAEMINKLGWHKEETDTKLKEITKADDIKNLSGAQKYQLLQKLSDLVAQQEQSK